MNIDNEIIFTVLVYWPPGEQKDVDLYQLLQELRMIEETRHHRMILCGDFNMDQLLQENKSSSETTSRI